VETNQSVTERVTKGGAAPDFSRFVGDSTAMKRVYNTISYLLDNDSTVLILGESGTGKELVARSIHENSLNADKPLITVNCGAIPEELLESELFGHEKGSFTGAIRTRIGKFELADGGSIFLDEIGDMSPTLQVKLLRILQEREFERVGGAKTIKVNVRVIAATNQNLEKAIAEKRFREDLYYRLNVIPIELPSLVERENDIDLLISTFTQRFNKQKNRSVKGITPDALARLKNHSWPGNVRELEHMIERLVILKGEGWIETHDLPPKFRQMSPEEETQITNDMLLVGDPDDLVAVGVEGLQAPEPPLSGGAFAEKPSAFAELRTDRLGKSAPLPPMTPDNFELSLPDDGLNLKETMDRFESQLILAAMERCGGVKNKAANLLGLNRTTLVEKLKKKKLLEKKQDRESQEPEPSEESQFVAFDPANPHQAA